MHAHIYIDNQGTIFPAPTRSGTALQQQVITIERQGREMRVSIFKSCSFKALLVLLMQIRSMRQNSIKLLSELNSLRSQKFPNVSSFCVAVGQACLFEFEKSHSPRFMSYMNIWTRQTGDQLELPQDMIDLSAMRLSAMDTPTALTRIPERLTAHGAFYRFAPNYDLQLVKLPDNMLYPRLTGDEHADQLEEAIQDESYHQWLMITSHITIALRHPIRQFGHLHIDSLKTASSQPFTKLLYPIASESEQPRNYRLLTMTYLTEQKAYIL